MDVSVCEPCACFSCKRADALQGAVVERFGFEETDPKVAIVATFLDLGRPVATVCITISLSDRLKVGPVVPRGNGCRILLIIA